MIAASTFLNSAGVRWVKFYYNFVVLVYFRTLSAAHYRSPTPALKSGQYKAKTAQKSGYKAIISNGEIESKYEN